MDRATLDICVPVYNESAIIAKSLAMLTDLLQETDTEYSVIVSDDGSTDDTLIIATSLKLPGVHILSNSHRGKGAVIISAAISSTANMFGFIDADLSADPRELKKLVSLVQSGQCDIAIGSRLIDTHIVDRDVLRTSTSTL